MELKQFLIDNSISITSEFIPFSKKTGKQVKDCKLYDLRLYWKIALFHKDRLVLESDFNCGIAHCPAHANFVSVMIAEGIRHECENGTVFLGHKFSYITAGKKIEPDICDVVTCLVLDGNALNYSCFKDWADSYGYNPDSIAHKSIYDQCLQVGLQLRSGLGEKLLNELQTVVDTPYI